MEISCQDEGDKRTQGGAGLPLREEYMRGYQNDV